MRYRKLRRKSSVFLGQNQGIWGYRHGQATAVPGTKTKLQSLATATTLHAGSWYCYHPTCRIVVLLPPYMQDPGTATTLHAGSWYCYHPTCRIVVLLPPYMQDRGTTTLQPYFIYSVNKYIY